ncbi:MAG: hypothetical protein LBO71_01185 [Prevotellaceae bacterium]|jgi:hypothetical protein|nr:hypothetical protein [Prevotellaceae bacterium]
MTEIVRNSINRFATGYVFTAGDFQIPVEKQNTSVPLCETSVFHLCNNNLQREKGKRKEVHREALRGFPVNSVIL